MGLRERDEVHAHMCERERGGVEGETMKERCRGSEGEMERE